MNLKDQLHRLDADFFGADTLTIARKLIGTLIVRERQGERLIARIVETEAYTADDPACHAYANAQKQRLGKSPSGRSALLFGPPGRAYVYLNYGMYWLFNVVTERTGEAGAVLVRAVEPVEGIECMRRLRPRVSNDEGLCNGPGKLTLALDIGPDFNNHDLLASPELYLARPDATLRKKYSVKATTRIGITKATDRLWRFCAADNRFVSKKPVG